MKALITLVILVAIYLFVKGIMGEYQAKQKKEQATEQGIPSDGLAGLPSNFEPSLQAAEAQGAPALKAWLTRYSSYVQDPKLASIQLDYVVMVGRTDPAEAKRVFHAVKGRTPKTSPIYARVQKLDSTFGR
jgi:hypothetical protein